MRGVSGSFIRARNLGTQTKEATSRTTEALACNSERHLITAHLVELIGRYPSKEEATCKSLNEELSPHFVPFVPWPWSRFTFLFYILHYTIGVEESRIRRSTFFDPLGVWVLDCRYSPSCMLVPLSSPQPMVLESLTQGNVAIMYVPICTYV